jgi:dTDP-4-dehydrorhamnose reductase
MEFAVIGNKGMFGREMESYLKGKGHRVLGFNRTNLDLSLPVEAIAKSIGTADVVVNAVAYTLVDQAEENENLANLINGEYAGKLAQVAKIIDAQFMHISTDYVFPGTSEAPISIHSQTAPVNAYGRSKLLGEKLVADSQADYRIFRTAWLYGAAGPCFPKSILNECRKGDLVHVVTDQYGQPTWARDLAQVVYGHSVTNYKEPVVHAVASGSSSWFEFARAIADALPKSDKCQVNPISRSELNLKAKRPGYSVLENTSTAGPVIGDWLERWKVAAPEILKSVE